MSDLSTSHDLLRSTTPPGKENGSCGVRSVRIDAAQHQRPNTVVQSQMIDNNTVALRDNEHKLGSA